MAGGQFEFVTYTGHPGADAKRQLRKVRTHVMHDYFRKKGRDCSKSVKENVRTAVDPDRKKHEESTSRTKDSGSEDQARHVYRKVRNPSLPATHAHIADRAVPSKDLFLPDRHGRCYSVSADVNSWSIDPFDVLPCVGRDRDGEIVRWYLQDRELSAEERLPWLYQQNTGMKRGFWSYASQDKGLFHVLLSIAEFRHASTTGRQNSSRLLYHIGEAMRTIRDTLSNKDAQLSDTLILLISTQVSQALGDEDYTAAKLHMNAIRKIMEQQTISTEKPLVVNGLIYLHVVANDMRLASVTMSKPMLQFGPPPVGFPDAFMDEAHRRTLITSELLTIVLRSSIQPDLLLSLHQMSLLLDRQYASLVSIEQACGGIQRQTLHSACVLVGDIGDLQHARNDQSSANPTDMLSICMLIFAWLCWPSASPTVYYSSITMNIDAALVTRLWLELRRSNNIIEDWLDTGASLECLLWILFIGSVGACRASHRKGDTSSRLQLRLFVRVLRDLLPCLGISRLGEFELRLKLFPWTAYVIDRYCTLLASHLGLDGGILSLPTSETALTVSCDKLLLDAPVPGSAAEVPSGLTFDVNYPI